MRAHADTLWALLRRGPRLARGETFDVTVSPEARVRVHLHRPAAGVRGTLLLVHGLGGCADSWYVRQTAAQALERGWVALRMNCRNCGATEHLSQTLFDATQSGDIAAVLEDARCRDLPRPLAAAGFSLGGTLLLRYAAQSGAACRLAALAAINPALDLACAARVLERALGGLYGIYFTAALCRMLERVRRVRAEPLPPARWWRLRSVRTFDERYVAPAAGFRSADAYYFAASPARALDRIARPTLILAPRNDPILPCAQGLPRRRRHGCVRWLHPERGGHLGYPRRPGKPFWPARVALRFLERAARA